MAPMFIGRLLSLAYRHLLAVDFIKEQKCLCACSPSGQCSRLVIMGSSGLNPACGEILSKPKHTASLYRAFMITLPLSWYNWNEPSCEIMVLFVLHKFILQTGMYSHLVGLDVWFLVVPFVYFHTSCVRTAKALVRLHRLAEPSLVAYVISTIISWAGSNTVDKSIIHGSWALQF